MVDLKDDAQTSFRLSSRLLERGRALGDALGISGQSELIRVALETGVTKLENDVIVGKATIAAAALEALIATRQLLGNLMTSVDVDRAYAIAAGRDATACRVLWRDTVATVRNFVADKSDADVAALVSEMMRLSSARITPIQGVTSWASQAERELIGEERWQRIHVVTAPKGAPELVVGYWFDDAMQAPISPPVYFPTGAYLAPVTRTPENERRALDFVNVDDVWRPLSHAATFTWAHTSALERGRSQVFVTWSERGQRIDRRVVALNRLPPVLVASTYGKPAARLARKDYDAIELVFDQPLA